MAVKMQDEEYKKLEVMPCDVKGIQNSPKGISDFWIKALLAHPIGDMISEKDRPILGYLLNIELELHPEDKGEGFDLIFTFSENSYFEGTVLKKELHMKTKGICDKILATKYNGKTVATQLSPRRKRKRREKRLPLKSNVRLSSISSPKSTQKIQMLSPPSQRRRNRETKMTRTTKTR